MIDSEKINDIVVRIANKFNPERIILFGSYATGMPGKDSDLDLLIIRDTALPMHERGNEIRLSLIGTGIPVDILVFTKSEFETEKHKKFSFLSSVLKNSKVLYEQAD